MNRDGRIVRLNEAFLYVDDIFLDLVEKERKTGHKRRKKTGAFWGMAAACVCLVIVLPAVAMAYNWFGLQGLLLPDRANEPTTQILSEYQESPEILALTEWKEFLENYETGGVRREETEDEEFFDKDREDWQLYGVDSRDMGEQLDDIANRHGLKLHTERRTYGLEALENMVGGKFIKADCTGESVMYEDYSFRLEGSMELEKFGSFEFKLSYTVRGTFDDSLPLMGNLTDATQWEYLSADGEAVEFAVRGEEAVILTCSDNCFITVTVTDKNLTKEFLQTLAERINFRLLKKGVHIGRDWLESSSGNGDRVSLSGYQSSPESQALAEWREFLDGYDMDAAIGYGNQVFHVEGREEWSLYEVYNYEMGEKLDEIVNKYGLRLYSEIYTLEPEETENRLGESRMKDCVLYDGYIYDDGTFQFPGDAEFKGSKETSFEFRRAVKGTFSDVYLNIGEADGYTEWQYVSSGGETVLLAIGSVKSLIFADLDHCFISVNVLSGSNNGITREDMQELADRIDFAALDKIQE